MRSRIFQVRRYQISVISGDKPIQFIDRVFPNNWILVIQARQQQRQCVLTERFFCISESRAPDVGRSMMPLR